MLHFPSTSTAADTARPADVLRLRQLLGDHVWAFSNCRVDVPGQHVAEVDWLFYNSTSGTFMVSEWKHFPSPVGQAMDEGKPWVLTDGSTAANPVEQVSRQAKAVRKALRCSIREQHFPTIDPLGVNPYQGVYSPQVVEGTYIERLRYGRVHKTLDELAQTVESMTGPAPLVAPTPQDRLRLAESLADLFRCSVSNGVRRKIAPLNQVPDTAPDARITAIHRELAALHLELASLLETTSPIQVAAPRTAAVPASPPQPKQRTPAPKTGTRSQPTAVAPKPPAKSTTKVPTTGHLKRHVTRLVPTSEPSSDDLRDAFLAALQDGQLRSSGVHIGVFGSLVGQHLKGKVKLADLVPGGLSKWCLAQAGTAGITVEPDAADPSILRLTTTAPRRQKDAG